MRHLISLGFRCDVAFQLRMHGQENVAHFFDWLATPIEGVIAIIKNDFNVFYPDHLVLNTGHKPHCVEDVITKTLFHHQFPFYAGHMQPDFLMAYEPFIKKFNYLAERFRTFLRTKPVTLVRQNINYQQALKLEEVILERFPDADVKFLYIVGGGDEFITPYGHAAILKRDGSSLGDPAKWSKLLAEEGLIREPYRHGTVEILGDSHDDYNLSVDNRFSEAQLQAAVVGNPQSSVFLIELSRWFAARGRIEEAKKAAMDALVRNPGFKDARFQIALIQLRLKLIPAEEAAEIFCNILAATAKPPANWLRETASALLEAKQLDKALEFANRAIVVSPVEQSNYLQKVMCLYALGDLKLTGFAMLAALRLGNVPSVYYHIYAKVLDAQGKTEEAVAFEHLAIKAGGEFQSKYNLAGLLAKLGRNEEALEASRKALLVAGKYATDVEARIKDLQLRSSAVPELMETNAPNH
jgi:tetratricopeptide (TPR) repeat protein